MIRLYKDKTALSIIPMTIKSVTMDVGLLIMILDQDYSYKFMLRRKKNDFGISSTFSTTPVKVLS